jgi:hypothetical protein
VNTPPPPIFAMIPEDTSNMGLISLKPTIEGFSLHLISVSLSFTTSLLWMEDYHSTLAILTRLLNN